MARDVKVTTSKLDELLAAAARVREHAHAPYSRFKVGAAVLGAKGRVYVGCNVENASFGLSLCAERSAVASAVASGESRLFAVAVLTGARDPAPPCGMCLQTLSEFAAPDLPVALRTLRGKQGHHLLSDLLPLAFGPSFL